MEGEGLTQDEIALVLHRAAELDREHEAPATLDVAVIEAAAIEAGLSRASVCQALAELRVGALDNDRDRRRLPDGVLGPARLEVRRLVPGPAQQVERELHTFLRSQLFEQRRHLGERTLWDRREGLLPALRRRLDLNGRLLLNGVRRLEVAVAAEPGSEEGRVMVVLVADVGEQRAASAWYLGGGAATGAGVVGGAALVPGLDLLVLAALPVAAGAAVGGLWLGRYHYRREVGEIELALAGVLDRLQHRPAPAPGIRSAVEAPARPARRAAGG
ncbi:MAG TPA: hypothetical protein VGV63_03545 [Acidimicrobiales bacterium]|nr:hypothetical protein [Acidimicrobiales bacterium]